MRISIMMIGALALLAAWFPPAAAQDQGALTVQVRDLELRQEASFLSPVVGMLHYGDQVNVTSRQGEWAQVTQFAGDLTGWAHVSGLTSEDLDLRAGSGSMTGGADSDEVALAGKGFNQAVEAEYRSANPGMRYDWIDWMESVRIAPQEMTAFKTMGEAGSGQAVGPEGGAQ